MFHVKHSETVLSNGLFFWRREEYNIGGTTNILKPGQGRKAAAITVPVCVYLLFLPVLL